jgi:hypothetical protein
MRLACRCSFFQNRFEQESNFFRIVLEPEPGLYRSVQGRVDTLKDLTQLGRDDIIFGEVEEYRQRWYALGHSLGAIAYSLPLAPCESVDLAVVDWSRTDAGSRADAVTAMEALDHDLKRDRTIEETVNAAVHEEQFGWSLLGGLSGAASVSIPIQVGQLSIGGSHALGGGLSMSKGDRNIEARSLQRLHDSVVQRTNRTRSLNSTVIYQATQAERNTLQTRTVTNHNHCHALTVEYYEVLRNLRVETCILPRKPRRRVVLIPYSLVHFDWSTALRFRSVLQRALLDRSLQTAFDAIVRLRMAPEVYKPVAPPAPVITTIAVPPPVPTMLEVDPGIDAPAGSMVQIRAVGAMNWNFPLIPVGPSVGPNGEPQLPESANVGDYPLPAFTKGSLVCLVSGKARQCGDETQFRDEFGGAIILRANVPPAPKPPVTITGQWDITIKVTAPKPKSDEDRKPHYDEAGDTFEEARLLSHLNANLGHYNRAIWTLRDPVEHRLLIDAFLTGSSAIRDRVDDVPLAVAGNHVAYLYRDPADDNVAVEDEREALKDLPPPQVSIVSLPTRGVFAEAIMGACNSCEVRDVTRFWDWKESPCERPPSITGISPGQRGEAAQVSPAALPPSSIDITSPPSAPDPLGLKAILDVLGKSDIFRDQSTADLVRSILEQLSKNATSLAQKAADNVHALQMAREAAQRQEASKPTDRAPGGEGGRQSPAERHDNLQVAKEVEKLPVDQKTKEEIVKDILTGSGTSSAEPKPAPDKPKPSPTAAERVVQIFSTYPDTNVIVNGVYDIGIQADTGEWANFQFEVVPGQPFGQFRTRLPPGAWGLAGRIAVEIPVDLWRVPVQVIPGLDPFDLELSQRDMPSAVPIEIAGPLLVKTGAKVVQISLKPVFQQDEAERQIELSANANTSATATADVKVGATAETNALIEKVALSGEVAVGGSIQVGGIVAARQTLSLKITYKRLTGFIIEKL